MKNNINGNAIEKLCREYTKLTDEEIEIIQTAAQSLPAMASMFDADAFIDCPLEDGSGNAIVVAEARPVNRASSYQNKVVGLVATKEKEPAVCRTFQLAVPTKFMKAVTQENEHVVQTVEPILSVNGVIGVFIVEQRMDQVFFADSSRGRRRSDGKVDAYHGMMDVENDGTNPIADNIDEGVLFIDNQDKVVFRNMAAVEIHKRLGFLNEIMGANYREICIAKVPEDTSNGNITIQEVKLGDYYFNVKTVFIDNEDIHYIVTISDITLRKLQEEELVYKSVASKEMHHRVKNNLQTIAALLRLQRNNAESEAVKQALNETITRILAISSTHQILVENDMDEVKLNDVVANVGDNAKLYFASDDFKLDIKYHGGDFAIKFDMGNVLALILNELMQNSIKHAFKNRKEGKIEIMAFMKRVDYVEIVYTDNGCGFDPEKINQDGMGWTIIRSLVKEKLKGHVTVKSGENGTKVKIVFML